MGNEMGNGNINGLEASEQDTSSGTLEPTPVSLHAAGLRNQDAALAELEKASLAGNYAPEADANLNEMRGLNATADDEEGMISCPNFSLDVDETSLNESISGLSDENKSGSLSVLKGTKEELYSEEGIVGFDEMNKTVGDYSKESVPHKFIDQIESTEKEILMDRDEAREIETHEKDSPLKEVEAHESVVVDQRNVEDQNNKGDGGPYQNESVVQNRPTTLEIDSTVTAPESSMYLETIDILIKDALMKEEEEEAAKMSQLEVFESKTNLTDATANSEEYLMEKEGKSNATCGRLTQFEVDNPISEAKEKDGLDGSKEYAVQTIIPAEDEQETKGVTESEYFDTLNLEPEEYIEDLDEEKMNASLYFEVECMPILVGQKDEDTKGFLRGRLLDEPHMLENIEIKSSLFSPINVESVDEETVEKGELLIEKQDSVTEETRQANGSLNDYYSKEELSSTNFIQDEQSVSVVIPRYENSISPQLDLTEQDRNSNQRGNASSEYFPRLQQDSTLVKCEIEEYKHNSITESYPEACDIIYQYDDLNQPDIVPSDYSTEPKQSYSEVQSETVQNIETSAAESDPEDCIELDVDAGKGSSFNIDSLKQITKECTTYLPEWTDQSVDHIVPDEECSVVSITGSNLDRHGLNASVESGKFSLGNLFEDHGKFEIALELEYEKDIHEEKEQVMIQETLHASKTSGSGEGSNYSPCCFIEDPERLEIASALENAEVIHEEKEGLILQEILHASEISSSEYNDLHANSTIEPQEDLKPAPMDDGGQGDSNQDFGTSQQDRQSLVALDHKILTGEVVNSEATSHDFETSSVLPQCGDNSEMMPDSPAKSGSELKIASELENENGIHEVKEELMLQETFHVPKILSSNDNESPVKSTSEPQDDPKLALLDHDAQEDLNQDLEMPKRYRQSMIELNHKMLTVEVSSNGSTRNDFEPSITKSEAVAGDSEMIPEGQTQCNTGPMGELKSIIVEHQGSQDSSITYSISHSQEKSTESNQETPSIGIAESLSHSEYAQETSVRSDTPAPVILENSDPNKSLPGTSVKGLISVFERSGLVAQTNSTKPTSAPHASQVKDRKQDPLAFEQSLPNSPESTRTVPDGDAHPKGMAKAKADLASLEAGNEKHNQNPPLKQQTSTDEAVSALAQTDSERLRAPLLSFFRDEVKLVEPQERGAVLKNASSDKMSKSPTKGFMAAPPRGREKQQKSRCSFFSNCMCCTTAIH